MRPYVAELSRIASCLTSAHPNAGLPNAFGGYDETPDVTSALLHEFARDGFLNVAGSCCGSTPEHTKAIAAAMQGLEPRVVPRAAAVAAVQRPGAVRDRPGHRLRADRRAHERHRLGALPPPDRGGRLRRGGRRRARAGARRREPDRREHGRRPARGRAGDAHVPERDRHRAGGRAAAGDGRQLEVDRARGGPAVPAGQGHRQLDLAQGGRGRVPAPRAPDPRLRRGSRRDGVRRGGPGDRGRAPRRDLRPRLRPARRRRRLPAGGHRLRPERARRRDGDRGARRLRARLPRVPAAGSRSAAPERARRGGISNLSFSFRGNDVIREAMHAAFLYHAIRAGLDMGIVNAGQLAVYEDIEPELQGARRGRALQPAAGRDRAARRDRRPVPRRGDEARARPALARGAGREAARARARARDRRLHRGRHRGGAPDGQAAARRDRGAADGRHARRRRPLRLGPDVPAAGREVGARDEARRRLPPAVHGGREGRHARRAGQGAARDRQGRRARHRQEHRRRRARLQRLRRDRPRRDGRRPRRSSTPPRRSGSTSSASRA